MKNEPLSDNTGAKKEEAIGDWVIFKNNQLIAFNKPAGLPVQPDKTGDKSLLQLGEIFCKSKLFPIHRLDRPASGVILFAKTKTGVASLGEQFKEREVGKTYLAIVKNLPPETAGTVQHFIRKNGRNNRSDVLTEEAADTQQATLKYRVLGSSENYHLLEIELLTGRHHQIRAQLAALGCPIKGDVKYGFRRSNRDRSIDLHAWKLSFRHPVSHEQVELVAPLPADNIWKAFQAMLDEQGTTN